MRNAFVANYTKGESLIIIIDVMKYPIGAQFQNLYKHPDGHAFCASFQLCRSGSLPAEWIP